MEKKEKPPPDITMCKGRMCPLKNTCYRYRAIPSEYRQSYFLNEPNNGDTCEYFYSLKNISQTMINHKTDDEKKEKKKL